MDMLAARDSIPLRWLEIKKWDVTKHVEKWPGVWHAMASHSARLGLKKTVRASVLRVQANLTTMDRSAGHTAATRAVYGGKRV